MKQPNAPPLSGPPPSEWSPATVLTTCVFRVEATGAETRMTVPLPIELYNRMAKR